MSINGIFYGATANAWIKPRIQWWAEANLEGNYSDVTATLSYTRTNTGFTTSGHWAGWLSIGGSTNQVSGVYVQITNGGYTATISHTARVPHQEDGTCRVGISAGGWIDGTTLQYTVISAEVVLEEIPRAATVSATDADLDGVSMVSVDRKSTLYTHTLAYRFGELEGYLSQEGPVDAPVRLTAAALRFPIPEAFCYAMTDAASAPCTLTCTTYQDDTQVGTPQSTVFTVRAAPEQCAPLLQLTATDENPVTRTLTGDGAVFVKGASHVLCTLNAQGRLGARIIQTQIQGSTVSDGVLLLENMETDTLHCSAQDSRGLVTELSATYPLIPYFPPTGTLQASRADATGNEGDLQLRGSWFSGSFGVQENQLQIRCRVDGGQWLALEPDTDTDSYTLSARLTGLEYTQSHTVSVEVSDCISTISLSAHVNPGVPVFDWGSGDFRFHVPVQAPCVTGLSAPEEETDAANKSYVDGQIAEVLTLVEQKLSMTLLWENASPQSTFAAQKISLDLSAYMFVLVLSTDWAPNFTLAMVGKWAEIQSLSDIKVSYNGPIYGCKRGLLVDTTGITFEDAYYKAANSNTASMQNGTSIPFQIYGIKGVTA